ncbi:tail fiber assembly protein [Photorhabdus luminescens]|uniref:tail fiber assembly protein n=1 Tax=Photorhabdus luminescens TaxID=29488 RepID=UPI00223F29B9|nr:tail fiber assembly protein [Photorhabdus luminescens]MCW7761675.1 tail fiber assembly protein [Photorhabdus luminescens subsp. venezuelensis]
MAKYSADIQMARFDDDGLAIVSGWVAVYRCHPETREYIGADMDHVPRGFSVAANAYLDAPELPGTHDVAICRRGDEKSWRHVPDYRSKTAYTTDTGRPINITAIGALPDNLTLQSPQTPFDKWENKQWVTDKSALKSHQIEQAERQKISLQQQADAAIKPLQDAIDLAIATDTEKSVLVEWKKYRVRVNRVDLSTAPGINWPEQPA